MITYCIKAGTADVSVVIRIIDSTDGTPETGVVWNTSGIDLEYRREGAVSVDITEATLAALTTAHADGGFKHIGNGYYRLDLPDAACAAGAAGVLVHGVVTGMVVLGCYVQLVAYDPFDGVRQGMAALPNAAAEAAGGLYTRGTGAGQINQPANGQIDANAVKLSGTACTGRDIGASVLLSSGTGTGQLDFTSGVVKANLVQILAAAITGTAAQLVAAFTKFFNVATPTGTINSLPDAVPDATGGLPVTGTRLTAIPWNAAWDAEVQSEAQDAITASALATAANLATVDGIVDDILVDTAVIGAAGAGLTALATAAELAKVPKSDSNVSWNATALGAINAEVDTALNTAIPGTPTADSINERIVAIDANADSAGVTEILTRLPDQLDPVRPTGKVVADAGNTASAFFTDLAGADNVWNDCLILMTSGALIKQIKEIGDFADANGVVTLKGTQAFTGIPAGDDEFMVINR